MIRDFFDMDETGREFVTVIGFIWFVLWLAHRFNLGFGLFLLVCFLSLCWLATATSQD